MFWSNIGIWWSFCVWFFCYWRRIWWRWWGKLGRRKRWIFGGKLFLFLFLRVRYLRVTSLCWLSRKKWCKSLRSLRSRWVRCFRYIGCLICSIFGFWIIRIILYRRLFYIWGMVYRFFRYVNSWCRRYKRFVFRGN